MIALSRFFEPAVIILVTVLVSVNIIVLPKILSEGEFVLFLAGCFLFQTLLRDLWILTKNTKSDNQIKKPVFCLETILGIIGVIIGLFIYFNVSNSFVELSSREWSLIVFLTTFLCYLIKDLVISWRPPRIYRDPEHANIIVSLK